MADYQLDLIRKYCDTSGIRLSRSEKDLLCLVLEEPWKYSGFTSKIYVTEYSGKNYNGSWDSKTELQYRIHIDSQLCIYQRQRKICDGDVDDDHWPWGNAWMITDTRQMINILRKIEHEL